MKERDKQLLKCIARNLRRLREHKGLSQRGLANLIDDYSAVISRIEEAENMPGAGLLFRIAEALEADISEFYSGAETPEETARKPQVTARAS